MSIRLDSITRGPSRSSAMIALDFNGHPIPRPTEAHPPIQRTTLPPVADNDLMREVRRVCK